ncbi:DUF6350 family protein [Pseudonocardia nantongensis]|uniref:cell division protein PerM n=1 Tax=Pseudonocardia nantongensis TaxID=1181885 RepID=UPI003977F0B9
MSSSPSRPERGRNATRSRRSASGRPERPRRSGPDGTASPGRPGAATAVRERSAPGERRRDGDGLDRLRILLAATMGAVLLGYTMLVPVAALVALSGAAPVTADGALATAVPMWLAAHQIPIALDGRPLGVLPLLPTLIVVALVATASSWAVRRLGGRVRHDAGAVVATQAGAAAAVAVLAGALLPKEMAVTAPWASLLGAGVIGGGAAGIGVLRACGLPAAWRRVLAGWPGAALAAVRVAVTGLVLVAALVLLGGLVLNVTSVAAAAGHLGPGPGAGFGVLLLTLGYLPNALVGALSWALGAGVSLGAATSGPLLAEPGPLPSFPLVATLPVTAVPPGAPLVLLLPLAVGVLAGIACRRALPAGTPLPGRLAAPVTAAIVVATGAALLATVTGGPLAGGPYDPVSLHGGAVFGAALLLVGLPLLGVCAGPEAARYLPVGGGPAGLRPGRDADAGRRPSAADRARAARADRAARPAPPTVGDLVERRRTSGGASSRQESSDPDPDPDRERDDSAEPDPHE